MPIVTYQSFGATTSVPASNDLDDLGTVGFTWRRLYLGQNSDALQFGTAQDITLGRTSANVLTLGNGQSFRIPSVGNLVLGESANPTINIGLAGQPGAFVINQVTGGGGAQPFRYQIGGSTAFDITGAGLVEIPNTNPATAGALFQVFTPTTAGTTGIGFFIDAPTTLTSGRSQVSIGANAGDNRRLNVMLSAAGVNEVIQMMNVPAAGTANDGVGIEYSLADSAGTKITAGSIDAVVHVVTVGATKTYIRTYARLSTGTAEMIRVGDLSYTGGVVTGGAIQNGVDLLTRTLAGAQSISLGYDAIASTVTGQRAANLALQAVSDGTVGRALDLQTQTATTAGAGNASTRLTISGGVATAVVTIQNASLTLAGNFTSSGARTWQFPSANSAAWTVQDSGSTALWALDTRTATDTVFGLNFNWGLNPSFAAAAGSGYSMVVMNQFTVTLTGAVTVTNFAGSALRVRQTTLTDVTAVTVTDASNLYVDGNVVAAGSVTITNAHAAHFAGNVRVDGNLKFVAAAAVLLGTRDANTLAVITNNVSRWTFASASSNITAAAAADLIGPANTASMLRLTDGTTALVSLDSRNTVTGVTAVSLTASAPTIASAAGAAFSVVGIPAVTTTLTGVTTVTALNGLGLNLAAPTVTDASAVTVTTASTLYVAGAPAVGGSVTFTNAYALHVAAGTTALQATTLLASPLNFTAGAAFVFGTTDANTVAIKTNAVNRWTWASASSNVTFAGAADLIGPSATASMVRITNGTTAYYTVDSRATTDAVNAHTFGMAAPTIANVAGTTYSLVNLGAVTLTLSATTTVTAVTGQTLFVSQPTINQSGGAVTVSQASTVYIQGAPAAGASVTISNAYALFVVAGRTRLGGGLIHDSSLLAFFGAAGSSVQQTSGADLTNNVTAGGTNDTIANYTDLSVYANDAAAIRNDIYQLSRKLAQVNNALRLYGMLT